MLLAYMCMSVSHVVVKRKERKRERERKKCNCMEYAVITGTGIRRLIVQHQISRVQMLNMVCCTSVDPMEEWFCLGCGNWPQGLNPCFGNNFIPPYSPPPPISFSLSVMDSVCSPLDEIRKKEGSCVLSSCDRHTLCWQPFVQIPQIRWKIRMNY